LSIGGLIKQKKTETTQKIPILGDIPVIGAIFRHKVENWGGGKGEKADSELFIMLTPKIVSEKKDLDLKTTTRVLEEENPADPVAAYTNTVKKLIIDNLTYPALAVETGIQGALKLRIHLAYSGELLEVLIKESSGYKILDDHALSVVHGIASYPPFPSSVDLNELWIDIPIAYNLE
jgi:TonB family protein